MKMWIKQKIEDICANILLKLNDDNKLHLERGTDNSVFIDVFIDDSFIWPEPPWFEDGIIKMIPSFKNEKTIFNPWLNNGSPCPEHDDEERNQPEHNH